MNSMQYRKLGRTRWKVSEIGYGTWGIGQKQWIGAEDQESLRALNEAIDRGLNFIDTALAYGGGHSERLIGEVLKTRKERLYVATKVPPRNLKWPARGTLEEVFPKEHLVKCTEKSLKNLQVDRLDLLQLHVWDRSWLESGQWFETLSSLRDQGKIAFFGVSINDHEPASALDLVRSGKVDSVQVIYNIFDQSPEDELLPLCLRHDVGVIARVPFDEGSLTGKITPSTTFPQGDWRHDYFGGDRKMQVYEHVRPLQRLLGEEAGTLPELALRFCLDHEAVSSVIPGMRISRHVQENVAVSDQPPLSAELVEELRKHRWVRNFYPEP